VPVLLLRQQKRLSPRTILPVAVSAVATYLTIWWVKGKVHGFGGIPVNLHFGIKDYALALALGCLAALAAGMLKRLINRLVPSAKAIEGRFHWAVTAAIFGGIIGVLYLVGGESVQFNGSAGTPMLVHNAAEYSTVALAGLVLVKIVVTAWSLASGYRGGIVFPSVYTGVALSLLIGSLTGSLGGTGTMIGAIAGIFAALTSPVLGFIMLVSLLPLKLIGLALFGVIGATLGQELFNGGGDAKPSASRAG
jgi:H+/Cl- antiporter ClcA